MSREVKKITGIQPSELADLFKRKSKIFKP
jgi:hypothetical protein